MSRLPATLPETFLSLMPDKGVVLAGVSGGADSVALLYLLAEFVPQAPERLHVIHVHHGLRGRAADRDLALVVRHCRKLGIPYLIYHTQVARLAKKKQMSVEEAGRLVRYDCFLDAALTLKARVVALAHHHDDQVETLLLNLMRGAGTQGLAALRPSRSFPQADAPRNLRLVRPLLQVAKTELIGYLRQRKIKWQEDKSNQSLKFLRNRIRYKLLPMLEREYNPRIRNTLAASSAILAREDELINQLAQKALQRTVHKRETNRIEMDCLRLQSLPAALQFRVLALAWDILAIPQKSAMHLERLCQAVIFGHTGLSLPGKWRAYTDKKRLVIAEHSLPVREGTYAMPVDIGRNQNPDVPYGVEIMPARIPRNPKQRSKAHQFVVVDAHKIPKGICLRSGCPGDFITVLGMKGRKKPVKKILAEMKIPANKRNIWPLLVKGREVFWIFQGPISEKIKIFPQTKKALKIKIFRNTSR